MEATQENIVQEFTFEGQLTKDDSKTYHPYTVEVPEGVTQFHVDFEFNPFYATGRIHRNQIDLTIDDPDGIRGVWCIVKPEGLTINAKEATPGFRIGEIQAGTWTVYVAAHRVLPPDTVNYKMKVTLSSPEITDAPITYPEPKVAKAEAGWYRGDLHGHTIHSDGRWDVPDFAAFQKDTRGLDFATLSDHNTVTGLPQYRGLTDDNFLAMGGMELSTMWGHMLALGTSDWYDWKLGSVFAERSINDIAQAVVDSGALLIIAHPMSPDEPFCSGCHWLFEEMRPGLAHGVEIWNGFWHVFNEEALQQFYVWLNQGHRITATYGSDIHGPPSGDISSRRTAMNVVYASELGEAAILEAIKQGRSYVSAGPELLLNAKTDSIAEAMIGDSLPENEAPTFTVKWNNGHTGDVLRLIVDGKTHEQHEAGESGEVSWTLDAGQAKWCVAELRDANGDLWAVTNPIYLTQI